MKLGFHLYQRLLLLSPVPLLLLAATIFLTTSNLHWAQLPHGLSVIMSAHQPSNTCQSNTSNDLCGVCDLTVNWSHRGITCDSCGIWFHVQCQRIGTRTYSNLGDEDITWHCVVCGNANHSSTAYDLHGVEQEFGLSSASLPPSSDGFKPLHSSTPTRSSQQNKRKSRPLRLLNINFQSVTGKKAELANLIMTAKPDVIIGTETWLDPNVRDSEYLPPNYKAIRRDRNRRGGGVLVAAREDLQVTAVPDFNTDCEILWTKLCTPGNRALYICAYYRPDVSDKRSMEHLEASLRRGINGMGNANVVIAGDFNLPGLVWPEATVRPGSAYPALHEEFVELTFDLGLEQVVHHPTRGGNFLDLVLTNASDLVPRVEVMPKLADHEVVYFEFQAKATRSPNIARPVPLYAKADWDSMKTDMAALMEKIDSLDPASPVDTLWTTFRDGLLQSIKQHIPHKTAKHKQSYPWIT
ncbi:uncharacterized protein [Littorina saxatilis]|uniref:uncharacterized protein n=1 Tax=Littorina saxatilis TaxID=31220 RepID=UPI0038B64F6A